MGYRCIGIDTRVFGDSDKPWSGYGYDRLSDDVRCIIDALKLHDITLAGWSTAAIANTWINEVLFSDLGKINIPTLIIHGIHDKTVLFKNEFCGISSSFIFSC